MHTSDTPVPFQFTRVLLMQINLEDTTFSLLPPDETEIPAVLQDSIARAGIMHPPFLKAEPNGKFLVVSGRKRIRAAAEQLGWSYLPACVLPESTPELEIMRVALEETLATRPASPAETALFFSKILQWTDEEDAASRFLPLLGLGGSTRVLQPFLKMAQLETPLLLALHAGTLQEAVARELAGLTFIDRMALFEIITMLALSVGNQKKLLAACQELSTRRNQSIYAILAEPGIQEILNHPNTNPPQKAAALMTYITELRFPLLTEAENEFRRFTASLHLPKHVRIAHSPSFERDTVTLSLDLANRKTLATLWPRLAGLLDEW